MVASGPSVPPSWWLAWTTMGEHLFETDPSGALGLLQGRKHRGRPQRGHGGLRGAVPEGMAQEEAIVLGLKALKKATEEEKLNPKAVEIGSSAVERTSAGWTTPRSRRTSKRSMPHEPGARMVDIEDAIVARLESHGETFEILIDPKVVNLLREGKEVEPLRAHGHRRDLQERPQGNSSL